MYRMTTLYSINKPRHRSKVAILDFDWTICKPKNNKTFPTDIDDCAGCDKSFV